MGRFSKLLDIMPTAIMSRSVGILADIHFPSPVQRCINSSFARLARIDMEESEQSAEEFSCLSDLFTRPLKDGARVIENADIISPVDGKLKFSGKVTDGTLIEAKKQIYSARGLVGTEDPELTSWLNNAWAFTIYLPPSSYHRIHSPAAGKISHISYAPGRLLPVNRLGYLLADDLLPANERLTSFITAENGRRCALVKVGATCVGKISLTFDSFAANSSLIKNPFLKALEPSHKVSRGDQIACFDLGSTVVLFVENDGFSPSPRLKPDMPLKMGAALGSWH